MRPTDWASTSGSVVGAAISSSSWRCVTGKSSSCIAATEWM